MATVEAPPELPPLPDDAEDWRDEFKQQWLQVALAEKAWMLDKWQKQEARVRAMADMAATGKYVAPTTEDEMGVSIGNKNYYLNQETKTQPAAAETNGTPVVVNVAKKAGGGLLRTFGPALLAAGLAGPLGGLAGWWLSKPATVAKDVGARVRVWWGDTELQPGKPLEKQVEVSSGSTPTP